MWLGFKCWLVPPRGSGCLCGFRGNQATPLPLSREKGKVASTGLSSANCALGTGAFILLDFTLPWLLLIVLVSNRLNEELCSRMVPTPGTLPKVEGSEHLPQAQLPSRNSPCCSDPCGPLHHGDYCKTCLLSKAMPQCWESLAPRERLCTGLGAEAAGYWLRADYLQSDSAGVRNSLLTPAI